MHGYPSSSFMWRRPMDALAEAGWRAVAPDLPGYGDSEPDPPATWERQIEALERFRSGLGLEDVLLVVHDWGGLIGLRWACDHPGAARALAISDTGFFPDGRWHGMAKALRTEGEGEQFMDNVSRDLLGMALAQISPGMTDADVDECWKCLSTPERRAGVLELYRSGDFEKLEPYQGKLAALGIPTRLIWAADDEFAPVAGAHRLAAEIPGAEVAVIEGARHFLVEDAPERYCEELVAFARSLSA
ncbi:MAG TPA: alpha/beta fold hydrolase [Thermoleophilaceae bacterium]|nr:alpha/beta fold hydrolase [Thermoleophilaceae bacterium]